MISRDPVSSNTPRQIQIPGMNLAAMPASGSMTSPRPASRSDRLRASANRVARQTMWIIWTPAIAPCVSCRSWLSGVAESQLLNARRVIERSLALGGLVRAPIAGRHDIVANGFVVLVACILVDLVTVIACPRQASGPVSGLRQRVDHGDGVGHVGVAGALKLFDELHLRARVARVTRGAPSRHVRHARLPIEVRRLHHQRVALPVSPGRAKPLLH